ncbi:DUF6470 family protein [Brevibacillus brevis]|uniref:DUF6470 family protein n=1 Tax=Brevibacillus brevis TaxID=1393 RepID=UPI0025A5464E|nr:DUF6470 family protein [Brevibacillus brevis]WJQ81126.1 DUF6470 family protein [Brevibacillus brevis]
MQLARIQMQSSSAQIGFTTRNSVLEIQQPQAEMNLRQEPSILQISQDAGVLFIDSSRARESSGLRSPMQFSDGNYQFSKQQLLDAIAKISQEGDSLRAIENPGNAIAALAFDKIGISPTPLSTPSSPDEGVDVTYQAKPVEIHVKRGGMKMDPVYRPPIFKYKPGDVNVYMKQYQQLRIEVVGLNMDQSL